MSYASARPKTAWVDVTPLALPPIDRNSTADVCVIGPDLAAAEH